MQNTLTLSLDLMENTYSCQEGPFMYSPLVNCVDGNFVQILIQSYQQLNLIVSVFLWFYCVKIRLDFSSFFVRHGLEII